MNKSLFGFLTILIALFLGAIYYTNIIQTPILTFSNYIKNSYRDSVEMVEKNIEKYLFQAKYIEELNDKLVRYENNHLVMQELASEVNDLFVLNNSKLKIDPRVELVRAVSYKDFSNFNRVWLETKELNSSKVYGLVYKELVAGIVVTENSKPLALLNKDIKSTYSVYVGKKLAPGIAQGNNAKNILIKYIPEWFVIAKGDEVITSGLDNIFFKGLKVGRIISVSSSQGYQNAVVEPYYKSNNPDYFRMIRKVK